MLQPSDDDEDVELKVRPEFGVGGARGKLLLLQSCRTKGASIQSEGEISTFLSLLEKQQQEQSSFNESVSKEQRHGVGYKVQNSVVPPKPATWLINQDHSHEEAEPIEEYHREVMDSSSSNSSDADNKKINQS